MRLLNCVFIFLLIFIIGCESQSSIISQRQEFISKFTDDAPSQYVQSVSYDHFEVFFEEISDEYAERSLNDKEFWELSPYELYNSKLSFEDVETLSPDVRKSLKDAIRQDFEDALRNKGESSGVAVTLQYPGDFANGSKSVIYILPKAFDKEYIKRKNQKHEIPTELKIRTLLVHEYTHAKNNFEGIKIDDKLAISSQNRFNFDQDVVHFADEVQAHMEDIRFAKQFGEDNPGYLYSLNLLLGDFIYFRSIFEDKNLTSDENEMIDLLSSKVEDILPKNLEDFEVI